MKKHPFDQIVRVLKDGTEIVLDITPCPGDRIGFDIASFEFFYQDMFPDDEIIIRCYRFVK